MTWNVGDRAEWDNYYPGERLPSVWRGTVIAVEGAVIVVKCDPWTCFTEPVRIDTEWNYVDLRKK